MNPVHPPAWNHPPHLRPSRFLLLAAIGFLVWKDAMSADSVSLQDALGYLSLACLAIGLTNLFTGEMNLRQRIAQFGVRAPFTVAAVCGICCLVGVGRDVIIKRGGVDGASLAAIALIAVPILVVLYLWARSKSAPSNTVSAPTAVPVAVAATSPKRGPDLRYESAEMTSEGGNHLILVHFKNAGDDAAESVTVTTTVWVCNFEGYPHMQTRTELNPWYEGKTATAPLRLKTASLERPFFLVVALFFRGRETRRADIALTYLKWVCEPGLRGFYGMHVSEEAEMSRRMELVMRPRPEIAGIAQKMEQQGESPELVSQMLDAIIELQRKRAVDPAPPPPVDAAEKAKLERLEKWMEEAIRWILLWRDCGPPPLTPPPTEKTEKWIIEMLAWCKEHLPFNQWQQINNPFQPAIAAVFDPLQSPSDQVNFIWQRLHNYERHLRAFVTGSPVPSPITQPQPVPDKEGPERPQAS